MSFDYLTERIANINIMDFIEGKSFLYLEGFEIKHHPEYTLEKRQYEKNI